MKTPIAALAAALATLTFAACGGDDEPAAETTSATAARATTSTTDTTQEPPPVSHADFVSDLDGVCAATNRKLKPLQLRFQILSESQRDELAQVTDDVADVYDDAVDDLEALTAPDEDADAFARYVGAVKRTQGVVGRIGAAIRSGQDDEVVRLGKLQDGFNDAKTTAAIDLGADECGKSVAGS